MPGCTAISLYRQRHLPLCDFSGSDASVNSETGAQLLSKGAIDHVGQRSGDQQLSRGAFDPKTQLLYVGQRNGCVSCVPASTAGVTKPKLLGSHGGVVTGLCLRPWRAWPLLASCSADCTIKLWTHEPKALHSNKALLQTLHGHAAAVTCVAAVHDCLVSGGADGSVLLWRPAEDALLVRPTFQLVAQLWSSQHWVLSLAGPLEPSEAGAGQGVFVAAANQLLLQLRLNRRAIQAAAAAPDSATCLQPGSCSNVLGFAQTNAPAASNSSLPGATGAAAGLAHGSPRARRVRHRPEQSAGSSSSGSAGVGTARSSSRTGGSGRGADATSSLAAASQDLSVFAVQYVPHKLALLTLAYDGCCRVHSAVDGGLRCCWHSPGSSRFVAMACTGQHGEVLIGDDQGMLFVFSLNSERLLATKQVTHGRIADIISCSSGASSSSSSSHQFAVLSSSGLTQWQLRRGLQHGILPGGHKQAVIGLQVCAANVSVAGSEQAVAAATTGADATGAAAAQDASADAAAVAVSKGDGGAAPPSSSSGAMMLLSAGLDNRVLEWDLAGGPSVLTSLDLDSVGSDLAAIAFLQDWAILSTGHDDGRVLLWRLDTGSHLVLGPAGHSNSVSCLAPALTAKGDELLLSGGFDGWVCLWEPRHLRGVRPHLLCRFQACGLSPDQLAAAKSLAVATAASSSTLTAISSPAVKSAAAAAASEAVRRLTGAHLPSIYRSSSWQQQQQPQAGSSLFPMEQKAAGRDSSNRLSAPSNCGSPPEPSEVLTLLFDSQNQLVVTGGNDGAVRVWRGSCSGELLGQHLGHGGPVNCLCLDGNLLFSGSNDRTVRVWDVLPDSFTGGCPAAGSTPDSAGSTPRHAHAAAADDDQLVTDLEAAAARARPGVLLPAVVAAAAADIGIASAALGGLSSGRLAQSTSFSSSQFASCPDSGAATHRSCCSNSSSSCQAASSSQQQQQQQQWRCSQQLVCPFSVAFRVLRGHTAAVTGVAVVAATGLLVSCGRDGRLIQFDYSTGSILCQQQLPGQELLCLAVRQESSQIFVGTSTAQVLSFAAAALNGDDAASLL